MERQIKKQNEELKEMAETLESRTQQLAKEKRENEANVNFIERMKIELEMVWQNLRSFKAVNLNRGCKLHPFGCEPWFLMIYEYCVDS